MALKKTVLTTKKLVDCPWFSRYENKKVIVAHKHGKNGMELLKLKELSE
jgi:hypothetical protein